ncbi:MAG TPA: M56 family metallopeptidase, partial [Hyphomonadaceae bacterium]|nr:M56 family metallopeptidase [Hyphomonadaceae bacterium]
MSDAAFTFLAANLAAAIAVVVVVALRGPVRRLFGAGLAYALWLLVPLAPLAVLLPARVVNVPILNVPGPAAASAPVATESSAAAPVAALAPVAAPQGRTGTSEAAAPTPAISPAIPTVPLALTQPARPIDWWSIVSLIWLAGAGGMLAWQLRRQSQFMADARAGFAGPAVAGFMTPRIVTPADFDDRFNAEERKVIIEHETIHIRRNDARINALAALLRCVCWFNPAIHLGAHLMRIDQELACDAAVTDRFPRAKAVYASALLKAELAARPLPLGCYWPARSEHPLTRRIEMLKLPSPARHRRIVGAVALVLLAAGGGVTAWAAKPPEERMIAAAPLAQAPVSAFERRAISDAHDQTPPAPAALRASASDLTPDQPLWQEPRPGEGWLRVRGAIEKIEFSDKFYNAFVRATSATNGSGVMRANTRLWKLSATPYWGDRDAVNAQLLGKQVVVEGMRPAGETCADVCDLQKQSIRTSKVTALPALSTTPAFGMA